MGKMGKMGKKRKSTSIPAGRDEETSKYTVEERFDASEDEFYAGRDKVLLDDGPIQKRRRKLDDDDRILQPSDEEILGYDESESDDAISNDAISSDSASVDEENEEDEFRNWGSSKADYYDADMIETEADAIEEEEEARRLLQKQLQGMEEADFGFDESAWAEETIEKGHTVVEKLPDYQISEETSPEERMKILRNRYPEFEPLAKDFTHLQEEYQDLKLASGAAEAIRKNRKVRDVPLAVSKFRALSAYLGAIAMYFALFTEGKSAIPPNELREHAIMDNLVQCRQLWKTMDIELPEIEEIFPDIETHEEKPIIENFHQQKPVKSENGVKPKERKLKTETGNPEKMKPKDSIVQQKPKDRRTELARLLQPITEEVTSDFGDEAPLTAQEAEEKARKKKSLRFYTSQIVSKSSKRGAASRDAGGDDDLPRKERLKDRQARLVQEAERRGRQAADLNEQLGDESVEERKSDPDEYYDMVATKSKNRKIDKNARAEAEIEATRQGGQVFVQEEIGPNGKRAITYQIEKNKGLTPKRKKDVRNPRVKKRKKYDEKMKKLGSMRQVYKGGEGRGGYGGELTGIKMNLIKSVKL